eukprot:5167533-Prymnesium_polylepis.1
MAQCGGSVGQGGPRWAGTSRKGGFKPGWALAGVAVLWRGAPAAAARASRGGVRQLRRRVLAVAGCASRGGAC